MSVDTGWSSDISRDEYFLSSVLYFFSFFLPEFPSPFHSEYSERIVRMFRFCFSFSNLMFFCFGSIATLEKEVGDVSERSTHASREKKIGRKDRRKMGSLHAEHVRAVHRSFHLLLWQKYESLLISDALILSFNISLKGLRNERDMLTSKARVAIKASKNTG